MIVTSVLFLIVGILYGVICSSILRGQMSFWQVLLLGGFSEISYTVLAMLRVFCFEGKVFGHVIIKTSAILLEFITIFACVWFIVRPIKADYMLFLAINTLFTAIVVGKANHDGKVMKKILES